MQTPTKPAPFPLELVRQFVNTREQSTDTEELSSPGALVAWLSEQGMVTEGTPASRQDLARAVELREALRAHLLANNEGVPPTEMVCETIDRAARRAKLVPRLDPQSGSVLEPEARGVDGALGRLLAIVHESLADGTWPRLKACRDTTCQWAFYDHTKNHSGAWCTMALCGNRAKARAYRERQGVGERPQPLGG